MEENKQTPAPEVVKPEPPSQPPGQDAEAEAERQKNIWQEIDEIKEDHSPYWALKHVRENYNLYLKQKK